MSLTGTFDFVFTKHIACRRIPLHQGTVNNFYAPLGFFISDRLINVRIYT